MELATILLLGLKTSCEEQFDYFYAYYRSVTASN